MTINRTSSDPIEFIFILDAPHHLGEISPGALVPEVEIDGKIHHGGTVTSVDRYGVGSHSDSYVIKVSLRVDGFVKLAGLRQPDLIGGVN